MIKLESDPRELQPNFYGNPRTRNVQGGTQLLHGGLEIFVYKYTNAHGHWTEFKAEGKVLKKFRYNTQVERDLDLIRLKNDLVKSGGTFERIK